MFYVSSFIPDPRILIVLNFPVTFFCILGSILFYKCKEILWRTRKTRLRCPFPSCISSLYFRGLRGWSWEDAGFGQYLRVTGQKLKVTKPVMQGSEFKHEFLLVITTGLVQIFSGCCKPVITINLKPGELGPAMTPQSLILLELRMHTPQRTAPCFSLISHCQWCISALRANRVHWLTCYVQ